MRSSPTLARKIYRNIARDRKEPRLERTSGFVGVTRFEDCREHFLVNVLEFVRIRYTPSQKVRQRRADIIKQLLACVGIALLQPLHHACPKPVPFKTL